MTTLAGGPAPGNTDGLGAAAKFNYPNGIAVDAAGRFALIVRGSEEVVGFFARGQVGAPPPSITETLPFFRLPKIRLTLTTMPFAG